MPLAGEWDFIIEQGTKWSKTIVLYNSTGTAVNLTNCSAAMQVRVSPSSPVICSPTATITSEAGGEITLSLTAAQTAAIPAAGSTHRETTDYVYDLEVTYADGEPIRELNGAFKVSPEVTRP